MKKLLLLSLSALIGSSVALAENPTVIENFAISKISPNGRYATSENNGSVIIKDLQTGEIWISEGDAVQEYSAGHGNAWSNNGIMVGSTYYDGDGAYWYEGVWHHIAGATDNGAAYTNAITEDGRYICGEVTNPDNQYGYNGTMLIPALWEDADGDCEYESQIVLPHPEFDLFNQRPQYISALAISANGKVIGGQITDFSGAFHYPIVWTKSDEGEWSYSYPAISLFNPDHLEIPVSPGEFDMTMPEVTDYMSDGEAAAYLEALDEYYASGYQEDLFPDPADYMTSAQIDAYNTAAEAYNEAAEAYNEALIQYQEVFYEILNASANFQFNTCSISPNGKFLSQTYEGPTESFRDPAENSGAFFNLETGEAKILPTDQNVCATAIFDNGIMLGTNLMSFGSTEPSQAYIYLPGNEEFTLLYDYFQTKAPAMATWMDEHMRHDIESFDEDWNPITLEGYLVTGMPVATPDLTVIGCNVMSLWEDEYEFNSVIFSGLESGVAALGAKTGMQLKSLGRGMIAVAGDATEVRVYDFSGRCLFSAENPAAVVETGLNSGAYVVKATDASGKTVTLKAIL